MGNGAMATRKKAIGEEQVQTIRAAVLRRRGGPLSIETLEMEGPRDDEVLVRLTASGICHTDISYSQRMVRCIRGAADPGS